MARKRLVEEQRDEMRQRQESFKAARQKVEIGVKSQVGAAAELLVTT